MPNRRRQFDRPHSSLRGGVAPVGAVVVLVGLLASPTLSSAADPTNGAALAKQWCASCHVLPGTPNQRAVQGPPSFRDIAIDKPPDQLRLFLMRPHGSMPPLSLSRAEIDDLIAYIETLR